MLWDCLHYMPVIVRGLGFSLLIFIGSSATGFILGVLLGLCAVYANRFVRLCVHLYVVFFRATPMIVQLAFFYYIVLGSLDAIWVAIIAIGLNSSAYTSQIIKNGIFSIPHGQIEVAYTLGFTPFQTARYIVIPQAFYRSLPVLANEWISLFKDSALASTIGVLELFRVAKIIQSDTYNVFVSFVPVVVTYLVMTLLITAVVEFFIARYKKC